MVRAKFQLQEIHNLHWHPTSKRLIFRPQYDGSIEEDRRFSKATPTGEFTMLVDNPAALERFKIGGQYYVDFSPVPEAS